MLTFALSYAVSSGSPRRPSEGACEGEGGQVGGCGLVVSSGQAASLLELVDPPFDGVALPVSGLVNGAVASLEARFMVIYQPNPEVGMGGLYDRIVTAWRAPRSSSWSFSQLKRPRRWPRRSMSGAGRRPS